MYKLPLKVALPLGIGDCHWACQKLRGLSEYHDNRPIHAYCNISPHHKSEGFLDLVPFVANAERSNKAPRDIWSELPPNHRHPKWSTLEACKDWRNFDYVIVPNGHLEAGHRIETYLPEIETDYTYELQISAEARKKVLDELGEDRVLLYMSGIGPNKGFHNHTWTVQDWFNVIKLLNEEGIEPVIVGAPTRDDMSYVQSFWIKNRPQISKLGYIDFVGKTTIPEIMALIQSASVWMGLNSGLGIAAAMQYTPCVMFWSNSDYKISGVNERTYLHPNMQRSWLCEEQLETYRTLSYGSKELTAENAVENLLEVRR